MSELSQDEVTVLLIAKEGQSMIPIGRWEKPTLDLAAKGLLRRADAVNYFITDKGLQAIQQRDDEDFKKIREAQQKIVDAKHSYLSTACYHGQHERCRKRCKFCDATCECECHVVRP
jgi:hypothetical protein